MPADPMPTSTFGLLERVRAGDEEAFAQLFHKYSPRLAVHIHYKIGPELRAMVEVEDILQDTFLAASRQLAAFQYRRPGSFMGWLCRIADHSIVDAARFQGRQKRSPAAMETLRTESNPGGAEAVDSTTPSRILDRRERVRHLIEQLDALPEDYREMIMLAKVEGLSTGEISERLGRSRQNVAVMLHRAVQRLRLLQQASERR